MKVKILRRKTVPETPYFVPVCQWWKGWPPIKKGDMGAILNRRRRIVAIVCWR